MASSEEKKHFLCEICGMGFTQSGNLNKHRSLCEVNHPGIQAKLLVANDGDSQFSCHLCDEKFSRKSDLKRHFHSHIAGESLQQCELCSKTFRNKSALLSHLHIHNGAKPFVCKICDKHFRQKSHLNIHLKTFHNGEKKYECKQCQKKFLSKGHLERHTATHTGELPFVCSVCQRGFSQRYQLTTHTKKVNVSGAHACQSCERKFCVSRDLRRHMKEHGTTDKPNTKHMARGRKAKGELVEKELVDHQVGKDNADENQHIAHKVGQDRNELLYNKGGHDTAELTENMDQETNISSEETLADGCNSISISQLNEEPSLTAERIGTVLVLPSRTESENLNSADHMHLEDSARDIINNEGNQEGTEDINTVSEPQKEDAVSDILNTIVESNSTEQSLSCNLEKENKSDEDLTMSITGSYTAGDSDVSFKEQDQCTNRVRFYDKSFQEINPEHISSKIISQQMNSSNSSFVNNQALGRPSIENCINICSVQNIQVYRGSGVFSHSTQNSCNIKLGIGTDICAAKDSVTSQNTMESCTSSGMGVVSNILVPPSDDTRDVQKGFSMEKQPQTNVTMFKDTSSESLNSSTAEKTNVCGPFAGKMNFESTNSFSEPVSVESELGFIELPETAEEANEKVFRVNFPAKQNENCQSMSENVCNVSSFYGNNNESFNADVSKKPNREGDETFNMPVEISNDLVYYGPQNFNELESNRYKRDKTEFFEGVESRHPFETDLMQYGPANINEDDYFSYMYEPSKGRGNDFKIHDPANVDININDGLTGGENQGDLNEKDIILSGPKNMANEEAVRFGPLNFDEVDFPNYSSSLLNNQDSVSNNSNEMVPYGPANLNDDVHNGNHDLFEISGRDFTFSEASQSQPVLFGPLNFFESMISDKSRFSKQNEEDFVSCSPYDNVVNTNLIHRKGNRQTVANKCETTSMYAAFENSKFSDDSVQVGKTSIDEKFDMVQDHDYAVVNVHRRNDNGHTSSLNNAEQCVEDSSNSSVGICYPSDKCQNSGFGQRESLTVVGNMTEAQETTQAVEGLINDTNKDTNNETVVLYAQDLDFEVLETTVPEHMNNDNGPLTEFFLCRICNYTDPDKLSFERHFMAHSGNVCMICLKTFTSKGSLAVHLKMCSVVHFNGSNQEHSTETIVQVNAPFKCNICHENFSQKGSLKKHLLLHIDQKLYQCQTCKKHFRHKGTLMSHLRTHTGERPYKCRLCDKSYLQSRQLSVHMRSSHTGEKPYSCNICSKSFADKSHYDRHMFVHSGIKPYLCTICKKSFSQGYQLKQHMQSHSDHKTHVCEKCHRPFSSRASLKRHMLTHGNFGTLKPLPS